MNNLAYLSGQFLLAMPGIGDTRFERSVIAICAHDDAGAFGLCLHEPADDITVPELMRQLDIEPGDTPDVPVLVGGPVEPGRGFVLHSTDWSGQDTRYVGDRWALTGTRDILVEIARGHGPRRWMVALGYAGWSGGQLEGEMRQHGWFCSPGTDALLWETDALLRWSSGFATAGINTALLAAGAGHA